MAKYSIPGIGESEGMTNSFTLFPPGDYLLKCSEIVVTKKEDMETKKLIGHNFMVKSIVENADKLPSNEDKRSYIGKTFVDFIFIMTEDHPSYSKPLTSGGVSGELGIATMKSFLDATGNPIKGDSFNEQKSIGAYFEVTLGVRKRKDKEGNMIDANRVWEYRMADDASEDTEEIADLGDPSVEEDLL